MVDIILNECMSKLDKIDEKDKRLKLIWQWSVSKHINYQQYKKLLEYYYGR